MSNDCTIKMIVLVLILSLPASMVGSEVPAATVTSSTLQEAKLLGSESSADDEFGVPIAVSGETIVVGAASRWNMGASGAAYVYERNLGGLGNWGEVTKLVAAAGVADSMFGFAVDISGDTVVVGAPDDNEGGVYAGALYVFYRNQGGPEQWGQVAKVIPGDVSVDDYFGRAVAIDGDTLVVGAFRDDDNGEESGSVYIFDRNEGGADNWGQTAKLLANDGETNDLFGYVVSLSGDTLVVTAMGNGASGMEPGSAYVFERDLGVWTQVARLLASDGVMGDWFGFSASVSGDIAVIGAIFRSDNGPVSGAAYVFERDLGAPGAWGQAAKLLAYDGAESDQFGSSVAVSGDQVLVGAPGDDDSGDGSGAVYMFGRDQGGTGQWGFVTKIAASDGAAGDALGALAVTAGTYVIGAPWDDDNGPDSGSCYVLKVEIHSDGFETGDTSAWSSVVGS